MDNGLQQNYQWKAGVMNMEGEVRYCAYCGSVLADDQAFCDACGSRVRDDGGDIPGAVTDSPVTDASRVRGQTASTASKALSVIGFFIIGFTVVIGINRLITGHLVQSGSSISSSFSSMSNEEPYSSGTVGDTAYSYSSADSYSGAGASYDSAGDSGYSSGAEISDGYASDDASDDTYYADAGVSDSGGVSDSTAYDASAYDGASVQTQGYLVPDADSRYIKRTDTEGFTAQLFNYAKNEIYARHGRLFNSTELQNYFNSQDWYYGFIEPDEFSDTVFNEYEKMNIRYLGNMEEKLSPGGYVLDQDGYSYDDVYQYLK